MSRQNESFGELLLKLPWWVSASLGVLGFGALRWGLPIWAGQDNTRLVFAKAITPLAPLVLVPFGILAVGSFLLARKRHRLVDEQTSLETLRETPWKDFEYLYTMLAGAMLLAGQANCANSTYDPLALPKDAKPEVLNLSVRGEQGGREIPVRVYLPAERTPAPMVLFSHGLGGSREGNAYLGQHWAARGYVVVFTQHPGSDASVWQDKPPVERLAALKRAANPHNFLSRVKDIHLVLDQLERWNTNRASALAGRLDLKRIGMSGHSFGALTTQAVSGQHFQFGNALTADSRIKAAIMFSPSSPRRGDPKQAFGRVKIPWMLMTGTKDVAPIGDATLESRLAVFPALPPGGKYELVLDGAEHSAFADRSLPGDTEKRNPNHHRAILALSTAFWDAYLQGNTAAKDWLDGNGPRSVLEKQDRWRTK